jgi:hypothetical protein
MIANVGNTDFSARLRKLPDTGPTTAPRGASSTAPGVSGGDVSGVGAAPPVASTGSQSLTTSSQSLTISLAPGSSVPLTPETVRASSDRLTRAGSGQSRIWPANTAANRAAAQRSRARGTKACPTT